MQQIPSYFEMSLFDCLPDSSLELEGVIIMVTDLQHSPLQAD